MMDKREIIEQIRQKSDTDVDYTQFEKKAVELYEKFAKEYSPPKLAELKGEALLDTIFLNPRQFRKNLCYELEFGECKILGGIGGGSAAKYGLYFSEKEKSWAEGHGRRFRPLSPDEAVLRGTEIRDALLKYCRLAEQCKPLVTLEDYRKLGDLAGDVSLNQWMRKYLNMVFPDEFPAFFADNMQLKILKLFGVVPEKNVFSRMGQLVLMAREAGISNALFARVVEDMLLKENVVNANGENEKMKDEFNAAEAGNVPLNQILYGPPGTGKTYHAVLKAMEIVTFKQMFSDYLRSRKEKYSEEVLNEYVKHMEKINTECLKSDNIFRYYDLQKYKRLEEEILAGDYINGDEVRKNENSYYRYALKRYEEFLSDLRYEDVLAEFNRLKQAGQIEFVTFHQSYSYEEFVEGIRPCVSWEGKANEVQYEGKKGIFREICENAGKASGAGKTNMGKNIADVDFSRTRVFKMSLVDKAAPGDNLYDYCIGHNVVALGYSNDKDFSNCNCADDFSMIEDKWGKSALEIFKDRMRIGDVVIIANGNRKFRAVGRITGEYRYDKNSEVRYCHFRSVEWLYAGQDIEVSEIYDRNFSQQAIYGFYRTRNEGRENYNVIDTKKLVSVVLEHSGEEVCRKPYILIIDVINRGNISKIFGELITLIEDDKREAFSVCLPYSRNRFSVPKNLYIIGTMNTSDRSIASVDIALRRRFVFVPVMPDVRLVADNVEGVDLRRILRNINGKISVLLDEDHQIGHSYFMNVRTLKELRKVLQFEVLPLLNEYFYGDWKKLVLLVPGFVVSEEIRDQELREEAGESVFCKFCDVENMADDEFLKALKALEA